MKKAKLRDYLKETNEHKEIVIFSEGKKYWSTFKPLVDNLIKCNVKLSFISMENDDPGINYNSDFVKSYYIGKGFHSILFMNMIEAYIVVMTTPGLGSLTIKRSPGVKHYVHVVHAPTDIHTYRKYSFDSFDTIMCSGPHQIKTLRQLEGFRNTKSKSLLETGCLYYDTVLAQSNEIKKQNKIKKTVLIAPTWGLNGALNKYGTSIITPLLDSGYNVIIRPHPQQYSSESALLKKLKGALKKYSNLEWDSNLIGIDSFSRSDIMISDLSGVIFDYAFIFKKPVLSLDFEPNSKGFEAEDLNSEAWEISIRSSLGGLYDPNNILGIDIVVKDILEKNKSNESINDICNKSIFNWGNAGKTAANQLISILEDLKGKH